eukprot:4031815-Alexandrium_andersonii.AAC.1
MELFIYTNRKEMFPDGGLAWCLRGRSLSRINLVVTQPDPTDEQKYAPLTVNGAGSTCCGWSSRNTHGNKGQAHAAKRPFTIWKCQRAMVEDDIWFHENSRNFPLDELLPPEGFENCKKHNMLSIVVGPEDLGWP